MRSDVIDPKESKTTSWLKRFIGRAKKPEMTWPFPLVEGRMFVLTIQAGVEGYHIYVGGRHVTSFAYRTVCCKLYSNIMALALQGVQWQAFCILFILAFNYVGDCFWMIGFSLFFRLLTLV